MKTLKFVTALLFLLVCSRALCTDRSVAYLFYEEDIAMLMKFIDENMADLNLVCPETGLGFIHHAALCNRPDVLRYMLEKGADPDLLTSVGTAALHFAAESGQVDMVEILLSYGADTGYAETAARLTPFEFAFLAYFIRDNRSEILAVMKLLLPVTNFDHRSFKDLAASMPEEERKKLIAETHAQWIQSADANQ